MGQDSINKFLELLVNINKQQQQQCHNGVDTFFFSFKEEVIVQASIVYNLVDI